METENRDYKYFMQDTGNVYLGAKLSYAEILRDEMVNFKYKSIVEHYIFKDTDPETTLESHLYYMTKKSFSFLQNAHLCFRLELFVGPIRKLFLVRVKRGMSRR